MKKTIFICLLFCLFLPALQEHTKLFKLGKLDGAFILPQKPTFSINEWFKSDFQNSFENYSKFEIGFRNFFIRLYNQIDFSLFNKPHADNVIIGKDNVLYQDFYITAYQGKDFIGHEVIREKLRKLKFVQDTLEKLNIYFLFIIAPGKVSFMPENIPKNFDLSDIKVSNYDIVSSEMKLYNIHHIDFRKYFLNLKDTTSHPLFPKCGTHWSAYGLTLVADSVFKYFENLSGIDLTDYSKSEGYSSKTALKFTDDDIGKGMNLLFDIESYSMYYPTIVFQKSTEKQKPSILTIGDSFNQSFWGFYPYFDHLFSNTSRFWYYNNYIAWPDSIDRLHIMVSTLKTKEEIEKRKFILIVSTEQNLNNLGFGFIEDAYDVYSGLESETRNEKSITLENYIDKIRNDKTWLEQVTKKSFERHIDMNMMIKLYAARMLLNQNKNIELEVIKIINEIKNNQVWFSSVSKKAQDNRVTLEEMMGLDAIWVYYNQ